MPWLCPDSPMTSFFASGKTARAAAARPKTAVRSTAKGRIGLR